MTAQHPFGTPAESAALYVAGALAPDDASTFETHLSGCAACAAELRDLAPLATVLSESVPPVSHRADARATLLDAIAVTPQDHDDRSEAPADSGVAGVRPAGSAGTDGASPADTQIWKQWDADRERSQLLLRRAGEGAWEPTAVTGVEVRKLFVDADADQATMLVRMAAGTAYPRHLHAGAEECYVLQGDLRVGDNILAAGDYQRAPAGSEHGVQSTEQGCLLLITSSLSDELL